MGSTIPSPFNSYPLNLSEVLSLIESFNNQPVFMWKFIDQAIQDYLDGENPNPDQIIDFLLKDTINLNPFMESLKKKIKLRGFENEYT